MKSKTRSRHAASYPFSIAYSVRQVCGESGEDPRSGARVGRETVGTLGGQNRGSRRFTEEEPFRTALAGRGACILMSNDARRRGADTRRADRRRGARLVNARRFTHRRADNRCSRPPPRASSLPSSSHPKAVAQAVSFRFLDAARTAFSSAGKICRQLQEGSCGKHSWQEISPAPRGFREVSFGRPLVALFRTNRPRSDALRRRRKVRLDPRRRDSAVPRAARSDTSRQVSP